MKTIFSKRLMTILAGAAVLVLNSCSKLDEDLKDPLYENPQTAGGAPSPGSLSSIYGQLNQLVGNDNWFALSEHTTDELMGPTRGTDWDDFGTYRKLHFIPGTVHTTRSTLFGMALMVLCSNQPC